MAGSVEVFNVPEVDLEDQIVISDSEDEGPAEKMGGAGGGKEKKRHRPASASGGQDGASSSKRHEVAHAHPGQPEGTCAPCACTASSAAFAAHAGQVLCIFTAQSALRVRSISHIHRWSQAHLIVARRPGATTESGFTTCGATS